MITLTVQCDETVHEEGPFLLSLEQLLRHFYRLDIRVLKARQADDSLLRLQRTA